jgi:serine/threonine-protein kinase
MPGKNVSHCCNNRNGIGAMPQMTPEQWRKTEAAFQVALDLQGDARARHQAAVCADDVVVGEALERLLAADRGDDAFIRQPIGAAVERLAGESADPWIGRRLGAYDIVRRIASGGMGAVFLAERADQQFQQRVAIKIMGAQLLAPDAVARFRAERQILANLSHPYIAKLLDGGTTETGLPYLIMEYVIGLPVDRYCDERRLGVRERLVLFKKICAAVDYAHRKLIVHRDLKPTNILVDDKGNPWLLDFGIAKLLDESTASHTVALTRLGARALTPDYASPEQVRGQPVSVATDVYSLGVLLYRMLCGRMPHERAGHVPESLGRAILEEEPSRPSAAFVTPTGLRKTPAKQTEQPTSAEISARRGVSEAKLRSMLSGDLDNIVLATLRKEPERRYPSVSALSEDIDNYLEHRPVAARPDAVGYRLGKFARRHRIGLGVAGAVLAVVVFSVAQIIEQRNRAARAASESQQVAKFLTTLFEGASPYVAQGQDVKAADLLEQGTRQIEALAGQPQVQAELYRIMGASYRELDQTDRAIKLLQRSLAIKEASAATAPLSLADTLYDLGEALRQGNRLEESERYFRRALTEREKVLGRRSAPVADALCRLGVVLFDQRKPEAALVALEEALAIKRELGEGEDSAAVDILGNIGIVQDNMGRYDAAVTTLERTIELSRRVDGAMDPNTIIRISNLGFCLMRLGRYEAAATQFAEALALGKRVWGPEHSQTALLTGGYAAALKRLGRFAEAQEQYQAAIDIAAKSPGKESLMYASRLTGMGSLYLDTAQYVAADRVFGEALAVAERVNGADGFKASELRVFRARVAIGLGRYAQAERMLRRALAPSTGLNSATASMARMELATSLSGQGRTQEAQVLFDEAIQELERTNGSESPVLVVYLTHAASHYLRAGDAAKGRELAERAYRIGVAHLPPGNWDTAEAAVEYARALQALGHYDEARTYYEVARSTLTSIFGPNDPRVVRIAALQRRR